MNKPNKFQVCLAGVLRPLLGYKYKVVYTELEVNASFKKRYMAKIRVEEPNEKILRQLPKVNGVGYKPPLPIFYSRNDKFLNQRVMLKKSDSPAMIYAAYMK